MLPLGRLLTPVGSDSRRPRQSQCLRRQPPNSKRFHLNELHRIEAQAVADSRELIGTFYNGNRAWGVREVVVRVAFGNTERDYSIRTDLKPLSSTHFALNVMVDPGTTWTWSIIGARGIRE